MHLMNEACRVTSIGKISKLIANAFVAFLEQKVIAKLSN